MDILPDSRAKNPKGLVFTANGTWVPVFCANCGADGGYCPETSTHAFYLCNTCFKTHGEIAGMMAVPEAAYYAKVAQEQKAAHGRLLTPLEMAKVREDNDTPLARLLLEAP